MIFPRRNFASRPRDAWTAVFHSATMDAPWVTSSRTGMIWSTATTGVRPSKDYPPRITFPSSPAACARPPVRGRVFSESTMIRSRSNRSKWKLSSARLMMGGSSRSRLPNVRVRMWRSLDRVPRGWAAADLLNRAGHSVIVLERDDRIGGLLRYGIPEFKMEKRIVDRRLRLMKEEGVVFQTDAHVGVNIQTDTLRQDYDALLLAGGATAPRDLPVPGRELDGIHFAMEYLPLQNKRCEGDVIAADDFISALDKRVVIIGGGDTGADCLGTAHRQGAAEIHQLELLDRPPAFRAEDNPWPKWPNIFRTSSAHEEGGVREFNVSTKRFTGSNGRVEKLHGVKVRFEISADGRFNLEELADSEFEIEADLVLLAMGFLGPHKEGMLSQLGVDLNTRGNVVSDSSKMTNVDGVFVAGDMARGQSLIVWAIHEGREAARGIDKYLMGSTEIPCLDI